MSTSPAPTAALAASPAPGIDPLHRYALIIDARSPHEYAEDHLPGALNLPVVNDREFAEVGTLHLTNPHAAYLIGAEHSLRNIADHLHRHLAAFRRGDRLLVYCFRGGKRSRIWADVLRNIGFAPEVLPGGWKAYRRWVREQLQALPGRFEYRVLAGLTGCGKTRLLQALERHGEQIVDLESLASHRGSLIGALPEQPQPSQKLFDSLLLERLQRCDPARPVWVESESKKIGNVQLPDALFDAMSRTPRIEVEAALADRVRLLEEDYPQFVAEPLQMVEKLGPLKPLVGGEELARWEALAREGLVSELFERVLVAHYDPSYQRSRQRASRGGEAEFRVSLVATDADELEATAGELAQRFGRVGMRASIG